MIKLKPIFIKQNQKNRYGSAVNKKVDLKLQNMQKDLQSTNFLKRNN